MTDRASTAILIHERQAYWRIELARLPSCRQALGPDLLNAVCHCFVQAARLTALCQLSFLSRMNRGRLSSARHTHTLLWFTTGTLRELLAAADNLRTTLDRRGLIERNGVIDRGLCAVVTQWELDPVFMAAGEASGIPMEKADALAAC